MDGRIACLNLKQMDGRLWSFKFGQFFRGFAGWLLGPYGLGYLQILGHLKLIEAPTTKDIIEIQGAYTPEV